MIAGLVSTGCGASHGPGVLIVTEMRGHVVVAHEAQPSTPVVAGEVIGSGSVLRVGPNAAVTIEDGDALEVLAEDGVWIQGPQDDFTVSISLREPGAGARIVTGDATRRVLLDGVLHEVGPNAQIHLRRRTIDDSQIYAARGTMAAVRGAPVVRPSVPPVHEEVDQFGETERQKATRLERGLSYNDTLGDQFMDTLARLEGVLAPVGETATITLRPNTRNVVVDSRSFVPVAMTCPDSRPCVLDVYTSGRGWVSRFTLDTPSIVVQLRHGSHRFHTHDRDHPEHGFESIGAVAIIGTTSEIWGRRMINLPPEQKGEIARIALDRPVDGSFSVYESTPVVSSGVVPWPWVVSVRGALGEPIARSGRFLGIVEPTGGPVVVSMALAPSGLVVHFVRHAVDEPMLVRPPRYVDPCLVGTWRLTPENLLAALRQSRLDDVLPVEAIEVTGGASMTFSSDGTVTLDARALQVRSRLLSRDPVMPPRPSDQLEVVTGTVRARYEAMHGHLSRLEVISATADYATQSSTSDWLTPVAGSAQRAYLGEEMTYDCRDGRTLVLDPPALHGAEPTWVR